MEPVFCLLVYYDGLKDEKVRHVDILCKGAPRKRSDRCSRGSRAGRSVGGLCAAVECVRTNDWPGPFDLVSDEGLWELKQFLIAL